LAQVRSLCFARGTLSSNSDDVVFTVPAGHTLLFKSASLSNIGTIQADYLIRFFPVGGGPIHNFLRIQVGSGLTELVTTWVALQPGDMVNVATTTSALGYWLSGAQLVGVASPGAVTLPASLPNGTLFNSNKT
jgi:hypothetical protein